MTEKSTIDILFDNEWGPLYYGEPADMVRWLKKHTTLGRTVSVASTGVTMSASDYLTMRKLEAVTEIVVTLVDDVLVRNLFDDPVHPDEKLAHCKKVAEKFIKELS